MSVTDAENPYPLISLPTVPFLATVSNNPAAYLSCDMALIHNVFIRAINSIWRNSILVMPGDEVAFAGYTRCCLAAIHSHHHSEEMFLFPFLQTKLDMSHNLEQHEAFQVGMHPFEQYMTQVFNGEEKYGGEKTRGLLQAFADPLVEHLHEEIPTISEERLRLLDKKGFQRTLKRVRYVLYFSCVPQASLLPDLEEHLKNLPGKFTVVPFIMTHHNFEEAPNWPPVPTPVKWLARNITPFWHYSYWKFSPYTRTGVPQKYGA